MIQELNLRRKWTFRAHDRQVVFVKKSFESDVHVLTKAFIWALYLPQYPDLCVEIPIGNQYKPDVVQLDEQGLPVFWGEAGRVGKRKVQDMIRRFRGTHLVFAKWNTALTPLQRIVENQVGKTARSAPVDLISFPEKLTDQCIDAGGTIRISESDVARVRL